MKQWTRLLRHPNTIEGLYDGIPSLHGFGLAEMLWDRSEPSCLLRGTLARFPDYPKAQWEEDANRLAIRLVLQGLEDFEMRGWDFENIIDLSVELISGTSKIIVIGDGEDLSFRGVCNALHVENVYAYHSPRWDT